MERKAREIVMVVNKNIAKHLKLYFSGMQTTPENLTIGEREFVEVKYTST